jgi:hypothetical protein
MLLLSASAVAGQHGQVRGGSSGFAEGEGPSLFAPVGTSLDSRPRHRARQWAAKSVRWYRCSSPLPGSSDDIKHDTTAVQRSAKVGEVGRNPVTVAGEVRRRAVAEDERQ